MRLVVGSEPNGGSARPAQHFELGRRGEALALEHLERAGYRIVAANFTVPIGRNLRGVLVKAEIDVVGYDGPTLCFIEVKTRASDEFAPPQTNVDLPQAQTDCARRTRLPQNARLDGRALPIRCCHCCFVGGNGTRTTSRTLEKLLVR